MAKVIKVLIITHLLPPHDSYLETPKTAPPRQSDIADVRRAVGGDHLVHHQGPVLQVSAPRLLHLPEFLKGLHHIHCKRADVD